ATAPCTVPQAPNCYLEHETCRVFQPICNGTTIAQLQSGIEGPQVATFEKLMCADSFDASGSGGSLRQGGASESHTRYRSRQINRLPAAPTSALSEKETYHKVSGPLVEAMAVGIAARAFSRFQGRFVRQSLSVVISIPIWLMIILLSPFDAYFAAKHFSDQVALK
ncbi:MAG: hypothetical protein ACREAB_18325, partial [Blastocatellia bacterium]